MIKVENGTLEIRGSKSQIEAELTWIMHEMMSEKMLTEEELMHCIEIAKTPEGELTENVANMIIGLLKNLFGDTEKKG